ncbi:MAG: 3-deoxy-8-phosphooctulonate synthase [Acidobacteria bacterium]|nr:3-deoxy-8-phosphooctulonate synthase [Acidobacteriota bacterium]
MAQTKRFKIGDLEVGEGAPLFLICGPCVIESEPHAVAVARAVGQAAEDAGLRVIFKASFDKANRTSAESYRGPGLREGLRILAAVKRETGLPILTDIHEPAQAGPAAEVCDVLQIPAFLCRQTDLLIEAGRTGRVVNIKKGQFLAPWDMAYAAEKVISGGGDRIILTERGSSFGYQNLVVDFRGLPMMRDLGWPTVLDVTHSLQLPGAAKGKSGGQPEFIETLARAGVAAGADGLFFETHEAPERALSDGANALRLDLLPGLLTRMAELGRLVRSWS